MKQIMLMGLGLFLWLTPLMSFADFSANVYFESFVLGEKGRLIFIQPLDFVFSDSTYYKVVYEEGKRVQAMYIVNGDITEWMEFDETERIVKRTLRRIDGPIISYTYDEQNRRIAATAYNESGEFEEYHYVYQYTQQGYIEVESKFNNEDHLISLTYYHYDQDGNLLESMLMSGNGRMADHWVYEYRDGQLVQSQQLDVMGEAIRTTKLRYSYQGKITSRITTDRYDRIVNWVRYQYNDANRLVEKYGWDPERNEKTFRDIFEYDDQDKLVGIQRYDGEHYYPFYEVKLEYNSRGQLVKKAFYGLDGHLQENKFGVAQYEYLYNNDGSIVVLKYDERLQEIND
jgi:hypothetical protein